VKRCLWVVGVVSVLSELPFRLRTERERCLLNIVSENLGGDSLDGGDDWRDGNGEGGIEEEYRGIGEGE